MALSRHIMEHLERLGNLMFSFFSAAATDYHPDYQGHLTHSSHGNVSSLDGLPDIDLNVTALN